MKVLSVKKQFQEAGQMSAFLRMSMTDLSAREAGCSDGRAEKKDIDAVACVNMYKAAVCNWGQYRNFDPVCQRYSQQFNGPERQRGRLVSAVCCHLLPSGNLCLYHQLFETYCYQYLTDDKNFHL